MGVDNIGGSGGEEMDASGIQTNITEDRIVHYPRAATIFASVCAIIFIVVGIIGNLVTIIALSRSIKLRVHATTAFVVSLCVSDLLFCSINLPLTASRYISEAWLLGETACKLFPFFFYSNVAASLFNMVLIAINRYILIGHNHVYSKIYKMPCILLMVTLVWIFSFAMMVLPLVEVWGRLGLEQRTFSCTILKKDGKSPKKFLFAFGILLPCIIIIICYLLIFIRVRRSRQNIRTHSMNGDQPNSISGSGKQQKVNSVARREDIRLTRMMLIIFVAFLACFLPLMLVNVLDNDEVRYPSLHVVASVLAWMSAVINPFIYAVSNRQYRSAYRRLLCGVQRPAGAAGTSRSGGSSSRTFITDVFQYNVLSGRVVNKNQRREENTQATGDK